MKRVPANFWANRSLFEPLFKEYDNKTLAQFLTTKFNIKITPDAVSSARKRYKYPPFIDPLMDNNLTPDQIINNTNIPTTKKSTKNIYKEKLQQTEAKLAILYSQMAKLTRKANLVAQVCNAVQAFEPFKPPTFSITKSSAHNTEEAVLCISDWHIGERVRTVETPGGEIYDFNIAKQRVYHLFKAVQKCLNVEQKAANIKKVHILLLGDIIDGTNIFQGHPYFQEIDASVLEQIVRASDYIAAGANALSKKYDIEIHSVPSNHARPARRGEFHPADSWENVLHAQIKARLQNNKRVSYNFFPPGSIAVRQIKILNHTCFIAHGHTLGSSNITLLNALKRASSDWANLLKTQPRFVFIGHFHTPAYLKIGDTELFANGSLPGGNAFSIGILRCATPPSQLLIGINHERATWHRWIDFYQPNNPLPTTT